MNSTPKYTLRCYREKQFIGVSCFSFLYQILIQDTETSSYEGLFALRKKRSSLCTHILILPTDLSVNSI